MSAQVGVDDYALVRVPQEKRYSWWSVAVQRFGQVSALSQFLLGSQGVAPTSRPPRCARFPEEPAPEQLQRHATAVRRAQWLLRSSLPSAMGVGRVHRGAAGLARTLGEAGDAARLAGARSASGYFVHVDRLGLGQLLLGWTRTDTFLPAARSMLEPLREQPGDLLTTLTAYLDAVSSLTETATVLGVHRNTVTARIAKAQELLGVELTDPDERLALHLACRSVLFHT